MFNLRCCCCCGKALTDERSKVHGIGPECRKKMGEEALARLREAVRELHGQAELAGG